MKLKFLLILIIFLHAGIFYSQTLQWRSLPNSPLGNRLEDIFFINENTGWTIDYGGKLFLTEDGGNNWDTVFVTSNLRSIGFFDYENGIIGTLSDDTNRILFRTTNHGINWSAITNLQSPRIEGICGISIVNENVAYACGKYTIPARIIRTTDKGLNWTPVIIDNSLVTSLVDCYFWSADSGIVAGGFSNTGNFVGSYSTILKTNDGGVTWQRVYLSSRQFEWCWKISYWLGNTGFVSIQRAGSGISNILKSTDFGNQWSEIPFRNYDQQGIGFLNENTGWVGGLTGPTYETTNGGNEWHLAGWGINLNRIRFLNDTMAYGAGQRVYKFSNETVGIINISFEIPDKFYLSQNYPNPFNPVTNLGFGISELGFVTLKVYDVLGNEVITLVNENLSPGVYDINWNASNYPSGVYYYILRSGDFYETKKMTLLK
jgi:photosystem II stability/assembly factor-like uncharacterized protein